MLLFIPVRRTEHKTTFIQNCKGCQVGLVGGERNWESDFENTLNTLDTTLPAFSYNRHISWVTAMLFLKT